MNSAISIFLKGKSQQEVSSQLIDLSVHHAINEIPSASISLITGDFATRNYPLFDEANYQVGNELEITVRVEESGQQEASIFRGIITGSTMTISDGSPIMQLSLQDPAYRLTEACETKLFSKQSDKQMIETVLNGVSGLSLQDHSSSLSSFTFFQYVRLQKPALKFISERLQAHGLLACWENGKLHARRPSDTTGSQTLEIGIDPVMDIHLGQHTNNLISTATVSYWDQSRNKVAKQANKLASELTRESKAPDADYVRMDLTSKAEATAWLEGIATSQTLQQVHGRMEIPGNSSYKVMQQLTLKSMPRSLNGSYPITSVRHQITAGEWLTVVGIGQEKNQQTADTESPSIPAPHTQLATALKWEKDPEGLGRVPLTIPAFGNEKYWAYPAQMAAGSKQRSFSLPEANEQVIVGFLHGSRHLGTILTSVYQKNAMPKAPFSFSPDSPTGFVSTQDARQLFDSKNKEIVLSTPGGHEVELSDKSGLSIDSKKKLTIKGGAQAEIAASSSMKIKGRTIDLN